MTAPYAWTHMDTMAQVFSGMKLWTAAIGPDQNGIAIGYETREDADGYNFYALGTFAGEIGYQIAPLGTATTSYGYESPRLLRDPDPETDPKPYHPELERLIKACAHAPRDDFQRMSRIEVLAAMACYFDDVFRKLNAENDEPVEAAA